MPTTTVMGWSPVFPYYYYLRAKEREVARLDAETKAREMEALKFEEARQLAKLETEMTRKAQEDLIDARRQQVK